MKRYYMEFPIYDDTNISVHPYVDNKSVELHLHDFYEFVVIIKGSCFHNYMNQRIILLPGDVFLIPPHREHSYDMIENVEILNVVFRVEKLGGRWDEFMKTIIDPLFSFSDTMNKRFPSIGETALNGELYEAKYVADINRQGIIHLHPKQFITIQDMIDKMMEEQRSGEMFSGYMKSAILRQILVMIERARISQAEQVYEKDDPKYEGIIRSIEFIEEHYKDKLDIGKMAENLHLSGSHFRRLFKDVTGMPPGEYINRLRVVKSLQIMQKDGASIAEAAERVGIYDANYFSRLFKKIMGVPPRYYKNIN